MSEQIPVLERDQITSRFPEAVVPDGRKGYEGYIVQADQLIEVATALRDEMGYDYLVSLTGTDYLPEGMMEVGLPSLPEHGRLTPGAQSSDAA